MQIPKFIAPKRRTPKSLGEPKSGALVHNDLVSDCWAVLRLLKAELLVG